MTDDYYVNIRKAEDTPKDKKVLEKLDKACFPDDYREKFGENEANWLAYDADDQPIGFACVRQSIWSGAGYISRYGVVETGRGKGVGRKLVRAMERYGRTRGWNSLVTYTATYNFASSNIFAALGYKMYAPGYAWVGWKDILYWFKWLNKPAGDFEAQVQAIADGAGTGDKPKIMN